MRTWKPGAVAIAAIAALALTACGTGGSGKETDPPSETLRVATSDVISSLDPAVFEGTPDLRESSSWSAPLVRYIAEDASSIPSIEDVEPYLAESVEVTEEGSIDVTLRETTSSFGNPLTSEDVKWSFERAAALDFVAQFLMSVGGIDIAAPITVVDDRSFRINVTQQNPFTLAVLTYSSLSPLDSTEVQEHATDDDPWASDWLATNTAEFGPYVVSDFTPGKQIRLTSNEEFFGDAPDFSEVVIQAVPEAATRLQLLSSGEVDYADGLLPDQYASLERDARVQTAMLPTLTSVPLVLNLAYEPFADVRVRQAVALAVDREALNEGPMQGLATVDGIQLAPAMPQPEPPAPYERDIEAAQALLAEAGYPEGFPLTLSISKSRPGPYSEQLAIDLVDELGEIGIDVQLDIVSSVADFEAGLADGSYQSWIFESAPVLPDPWYAWVLDQHSTQAFGNYHGFANTEVDALLDRAKVLPSGAERDAVLSDIHVLMMENVPWVPLLSTNNLVALSTEIDIASFVQIPPAGPRYADLKRAG